MIISPSDRDLIHEGSEARRKFLDGLLSQLYPSYLDTLLRYNKVLAQRNTLLKSFHEGQYLDPDTLDIYDDQLSLYGNKIFQVRLAFLESFLPIFQEQYTHLSQGKEEVSIRYESRLLGQDFKSLLKESFPQDSAAQYTTIGIHKDDLLLDINGQLVKKFASQANRNHSLSHWN